MLDRCTNQTGKNRFWNVWERNSKEYKNRIKSVFRTRVDMTAQQIAYQDQTPLILASKNGHKRVIEILLERSAYTYDTDQYKQFAVMKAADNGHEDILVFLLEQKSWAKTKNITFGPALIEAAGSGQGPVVKLLLDRGVNIEFKNARGMTALASAARRGTSDMVKSLLKNTADIEVKDKEGNTPLLNAVKYNHKDTVAILLDHNADVEAKNNAGESAMSLATLGKDGGLLISWPSFGLLLKYGVSIASNSSEDLDICAGAAQRGDINIMRYLLEKRGLNVDSKINPFKTESNRTVTHLSRAARSGQKDMVEFLLGMNADIEARDEDGATPLLCAAAAREATVVDLLLEYNADIESRNKQGRTALLEAVWMRQTPYYTSYANEVVV